jgi:hypothetical protein
MPSPSLSTLERQRIAEAAKLAASGVPVKWRGFGMRLVYVVNGREHFVTSAPNQRVWLALSGQAKAFYEEAHAEAIQANQANAAKARGTSESAAKGSEEGALEIEALSDVRSESPVCDLRESIAGGAHGAERHEIEGDRRLVCSVVPDPSRHSGPESEVAEWGMGQGCV